MDNPSSGFPLFCQQCSALFKKNLLISWRNKLATFLQLFSSFFFILLMFGIQKAIDAENRANPDNAAATDPVPTMASPIPPCEKFSRMLPCYDFLWSGNGSARFHGIVDSIRKNNPGRPISSSKILSFRTEDDVDQWIYDNPMRCPLALHFTEKNSSVISYGIQTNSARSSKDTTFEFQIPLQFAAEREISRSLIGVSSFGWDVRLKEFAHPALTAEPISVVYLVGNIFFLATAMFGFVFQISSLVTEKELKLRQAMSLMGLFDSAYWLSWLTWEGIIVIISSLFMVLFGMMFQLGFFLKNSFSILFLLFLLFQFSMIGFAFMLSVFISKSSSSTTVGFVIFIIGFLAQIVSQADIDSNWVTFKNFWYLFPPNLLFKALNLLSGATLAPSYPGMSWKDRTKCPLSDPECGTTINEIYQRLVVTFFVWFVLAIYFDNIIPNASGMRKSVFYFLHPGYWTGRGGSKVHEGGICTCTGSVPPLEHISPDDEDVLAEETAVKNQVRDGQVEANVAVQIRGLVKTYPGTTKIGCCYKCRKTSSYHAIKGLWMNFPKDQLFCLLGPNGAGKTTTINCLTGITPVTGGDALIYDNSICNSVGMSNIRKIIGVCPQFDILWHQLTGQEHLYLFANIKGLSPASIRSVVMNSLDEVRLTEAGTVRAGCYSGGMKRRLSVAIALLGNPKLVILDEPTTGMDPITRRHVWDIIEDAKRGRAIILTTHSMEEADILGDRIGIMAKGRLHCIGTSIRLKSRFGTGFIANVSFSGNRNGIILDRDQEAVKQFFRTRLAISPKEESQGFLTYIVPHDREGVLKNFFAELQARAKEFGISDIQLSLTTLEEVFLNIAQQAELESAAADGSLATLTLTTGASVQVPVGARLVGIPGTESAEDPRGLMVEVYWEQDDSGALCISGHSSETPIPPTVRPMPSQATANSRSLGRRAPVQGIVFSPN